MFVEHWFLKDHDTEDWSNDSENSALPELLFKYIKLVNSYVIIFPNITVFTVNDSSLAEHNIFKNLNSNKMYRQ